MIKVTHFGEDYATVEIDGKEFETSLGLGEALWKVIGECNFCHEPLRGLIKVHHHTEDGKDVTV